MCNQSGMQFIEKHLVPDEVMGKTVIEVGALNVNGSPREKVERLRPASYLGVDISMGPGVDQVCDVKDLVSRFGRDRFDVVISTELMEHVQDWRTAISNLKNMVAPGGAILVTTRSRSFPYHGYPYDFWRFELDDMRRIFSDFSIQALEADTSSPGVFFKARKPASFSENNLESIELYSIVTGRVCKTIRPTDLLLLKAMIGLRRLLAKGVPESVKERLKRALFRKDML